MSQELLDFSDQIDEQFEIEETREESLLDYLLQVFN